jgi:hypothetical protein
MDSLVDDMSKISLKRKITDDNMEIIHEEKRQRTITYDEIAKKFNYPSLNEQLAILIPEFRSKYFIDK